MELPGIVNGVGAGTAGIKPKDSKAELKREEFLNLLVAEITHQNPLEPTDNAQFLSQLVDMENLKTAESMNEGFAALQRTLQLGSASGMIGKNITGRLADGEEITGLVEKVQLQNDVINLVVDGKMVAVDTVSQILP